MNSRTKKGLTIKAKLIVMMPDEVARVAVKNMLKGMLFINPGKMNWWVTKVAKLIPTRLKMRIMERIFRVYTKEEKLNQQNPS